MFVQEVDSRSTYRQLPLYGFEVDICAWNSAVSAISDAGVQ